MTEQTASEWLMNEFDSRYRHKPNRRNNCMRPLLGFVSEPHTELCKKTGEDPKCMSSDRCITDRHDVLYPIIDPDQRHTDEYLALLKADEKLDGIVL